MSPSLSVRICLHGLLHVRLQIWVYGNSFFTQLIAVIAPDPERLNPWAKQQGIWVEDFAVLCAKPQVAPPVASRCCWPFRQL